MVARLPLIERILGLLLVNVGRNPDVGVAVSVKVRPFWNRWVPAGAKRIVCRPFATFKVSLAETVAAPALLAETVTLKLPVRLGLPLITPVDRFTLSPGGNPVAA